jgi:hypothetical protein
MPVEEPKLGPGVSPSGDTRADFPSRIFQFDNFETRDQAGDWIPEIMQSHFWGDAAIAFAFFSIPVTIVWAYLGWRVSIFPNRILAYSFSILLFMLGLDHLFSAMSFRVGIYDAQAVCKVLGAFAAMVVSVSFIWWTVLVYKNKDRIALIQAKADKMLDFEHFAEDHHLEALPDDMERLLVASSQLDEVRSTMAAMNETLRDVRGYMADGNKAGEGQ